MSKLKTQMDAVVNSDGFTLLFEKVSGQYSNLSCYLEYHAITPEVRKLKLCLSHLLTTLNVMYGHFNRSLSRDKRFNVRMLNELKLDFSEHFFKESISEQLSEVYERLQESILHLVMTLQVIKDLPISVEGHENLLELHKKSVELSYILNTLIQAHCIKQHSCSVM